MFLSLDAGLSFAGAGPHKKALVGTNYFLGHFMVDVLAALSRGHGERVGVAGRGSSFKRRPCGSRS